MWGTRSLLGRGSRSASVESDQPGRTPRPDGSGFRSRMDEGCLGTPTHPKPAHPNCGSLDRETLSTVLTRRRLVSSGLLAMSTAALIGVPVAKAASTVSVWGLDPDGGHEGCGCSACNACRTHALNKIFASPADAHGGRAHPHCKCAVTQLSSVDAHVYEELFVGGGRRTSVDRRWQWVQAALASTAPIPTPSPPPPVPPPAAGAPPSGHSAPTPAPTRAELATAAAATVRAAWIRRLAPRRRVLFVQLRTNHPIEAEISLLRHRKRLASRHLPAVNGRQTIRIPLPIKVTRGPAQLHVRFTTTADGTTRTTTRMLSVPAKQVTRPLTRNPQRPTSPLARPWSRRYTLQTSASTPTSDPAAATPAPRPLGDVGGGEPRGEPHLSGEKKEPPQIRDTPPHILSGPADNSPSCRLALPHSIGGTFVTEAARPGPPRQHPSWRPTPRSLRTRVHSFTSRLTGRDRRGVASAW